MACDSPWAPSLPDCREDWAKKCQADPIYGESGRCLSFVRQEVLNGRNTMDAAVKFFCLKSNDPLCGCVNVPTNVKNGADDMIEAYGPITCWYKECTADRLLTVDLYEDAVKKRCPRSKCMLGKDDFDLDGTRHACREDVFEQWFRPVNMAQIDKQTRWLTTPLFNTMGTTS